MALTTRKSTTLTGYSKITVNDIENTVINMTANISENGNSNIVTTIVNQSLYDVNKIECRADMDEFTALVRNIEDENTNMEA